MLAEGERFPIERLPPLARRTVLFFYPVAFTGGWTREVKRFDELLAEFDEAGVEVIGASVDQEERNREFAEAEHLRYRLVSDSARELAGELGILEETEGHGMRAVRVTYLLDPDGTVLRFWRVGRGDAIDAHPDEVLATVRALAAPAAPA